MATYKQEFIDNYFKDKSQAMQETMGFYWAMKSRDFIPFIAKVFKKYMWVLQEPNDSGIFPNPKSDNTVTCFHEFQDWMDVASTKACVSMANRWNSVDKKPSKEYTSKSIIEQNHKFANGADQFDNWTYKNKRNFVREALWNFDDEAEAFGYSVKEFAGQLLHKLIIEAGITIHPEMPEDFDASGEVGWDWKVKEIWNFIDTLEEHNQGLPTRTEDAPEQTEDGLDLISSAMGADDFLWHVVDHLLKSK